MGKKAKLKAIRRLASQMPEIPTYAVIGERLTGKEALERGIMEVDGKPINQESIVIKKKVVETTLNHNRKMKQLYNQHGKDGVVGYIQAVKNYVDRKALEEKLKETQTA